MPAVTRKILILDAGYHSRAESRHNIERDKTTIVERHATSIVGPQFHSVSPSASVSDLAIVACSLLHTSDSEGARVAEPLGLSRLRRESIFSDSKVSVDPGIDFADGRTAML